MIYKYFKINNLGLAQIYNKTKPNIKRVEKLSDKDSPIKISAPSDLCKGQRLDMIG